MGRGCDHLGRNRITRRLDVIGAREADELAPTKSAAELRSAWTAEGGRPYAITAIAPAIRVIYIEQDVHHRRTIRASGSDHGAAAGPGRMPVGPRADLRHHQALHPGRNLR